MLLQQPHVLYSAFKAATLDPAQKGIIAEQLRVLNELGGHLILSGKITSDAKDIMDDMKIYYKACECEKEKELKAEETPESESDSTTPTQ